MGITQKKSLVKPSGGRYKSHRMKRIFELASAPTNTVVGPRKTKQVKTRGGGLKTRLLKIDVANVIGKDGKAVKAKIKNVVENPANPQLVRRNIITKGCIIDTDKGKAKVTSKPGQEGAVNAVLV